MNYYIFDVKRQRGENIVHSYAETDSFTHILSKNRLLQTLRMNYYIFDVKRQRGENIVHSDAVQTLLHIIFQKTPPSNSAYELLYFRRQAAAWRKYSTFRRRV